MQYKNDEKILRVLDIDETLIHATKDELDRTADFMVFDYYIYRRPHLDQFLSEVKNNFLIAVWSSASDDYVDEVVEKIFPDDIKLEFVWGRSRCTFRRNWKVIENRYFYESGRDHFHYIKPLKKLKRQGFQLDRILIVDDTPHKCMDNYGNAIYPNPFTGNLEDDELLLLTKYLETLKLLRNVRRMEKRGWRSRVK